MKYPEVPEETIALLEKNRQERLAEMRRRGLCARSLEDGFCPMCQSTSLSESSSMAIFITGKCTYSCNKCGYTESFMACA